ncbi:MAG: SAM-dependent methyltransferase [Alphaproteobacteria bacterium]|nr:SAM-dependent methyltransferase [Alphaproteobacteria bacterium]
MNQQAPPQIFDAVRIGQNLKRRTKNSDFLTPLIVADLHQRLGLVSRRFERAIIAGPDPKALPDTTVSASGPVRFLRAGRLIERTSGATSGGLQEALFPGYAAPFDLIVSVLDLSCINDLAGMLVRIRGALVPDGLFLGALVGGASLGEMRRAWFEADSDAYGGAYARVAPMLDVRNAGALLQRAGFSLPVVDVESHKLRHGSGLAAMADIKALGGSNPLLDRPRRAVTASHLGRAAAAYERLTLDKDGRYAMGLEIVWMSGWAPHASQQRPLEPGSARQSLRDALGDKS